MNDKALPRVLCVDDEPSVLEGLSRTLFEEFDVTTAESGKEGLAIIASEPPFAVVLSDMRMPGMDGAAFLSCVRKRSPDSTRVLLTGHADVESAIAAVNDGHIFRFLNKPCPPDVLAASLHAAAAQHRMIVDRKDLLEKTVKGSVKVLTDVLSLAAPAAFSRASVERRFMRHLVETLELSDGWQYELAAMLSFVGCITVPDGTLDKIYAGQAVPVEEQDIFDQHPEVGFRLLRKIPRFESVALMIRYQNHDSLPEKLPGHIRLGVRMLRVVHVLDEFLVAGYTLTHAIERARDLPDCDIELLDVMASFKDGMHYEQIKTVRVGELRSFMRLEEDVEAADGKLIVSRDHDLTPALIEKIMNLEATLGVREPIRVRIPAVA